MYNKRFHLMAIKPQDIFKKPHSRYIRNNSKIVLFKSQKQQEREYKPQQKKIHHTIWRLKNHWKR